MRALGRPGRSTAYSGSMVRVFGIVALLLWLSAEAVILIAVGWSAWPVVAGWAAGSIAVAALALVAHHRSWARAVRTTTAGILVVGCVVLTWEGGLFFVPASLALLAAALGPVGSAHPRAPVASTP